MTHHDRMASAADRLSVAVATAAGDFAGIRTDFQVERWDAEQTSWARQRILAADWYDPAVELGVEPYSVSIDHNCNMILQAGWVALLGGIAGTSITTKYSATVGRIGVGDSVTAAAYAQTDLQAASNKYYQLVSGTPTIATGSAPATLTFSAVFGTANGNFAWQEFITDEGTASNTGPVVATCLNRGVSAQGTKAAGQTWTATETISFGFPSGAGTVS